MKLTTAQKKTKKLAKAERQKKYEWIFINGKQVRVRRSQLIEGVPVDDFLARKTDPMWLHQNEMWEIIEAECDG